MERLKNMDRYQKGILFLLLVMAVGFAVAYGLVTSRVGYLYGDAILVPSQENGTTVYTGTVREYDASVIVTADKTVTFRFGNLLYGPYTAKEDPTAIPENEDMSAYMTGIQVLENGKVFFRGAVLPVASDSIHWMLYDENGNLDDISIVAYTSNGVQLDSSGNSIDPLKPSVSQVLQLMEGPELTHKGQWQAWFLGLFVSVVNVCSIIFAEELFYWNLAFRVRDAYRSEPSDWEITSRYIGWFVMTGAAAVLYLMGLQ